MEDFNPKCTLCLLVQGKLPSQKVFENKDFLVIYDKYPRAKTHLLVIDKKHHLKKDTLVGKYSGYWDKAFKVISQVVNQLKLDKKGYLIEIREAGLNHFEHEHFHILAN